MRTIHLVALLGVLGCPSPPPSGKVPVQKRHVIARVLSPNLMLLVDRSASMGLAIDPSAPGCTGACPTGCAPSCRTRLGEVQEGFRSALAARGAAARFGLSIFPDTGAAACSASSAGVLEPIAAASSSDAELRTKATIVSTRLGGVAIAGEGRPISDALVVAGALAELNRIDDNRQDFVMLITAGAPDCGELDALATIQTLRQRGIKTIIVGFGADARAPRVAARLDAMARAGGFAVTCPSALDAECGPANRCSAGGVCERASMHADTATELGDQLVSLFTVEGQGDPCVVPLEVTPNSLDALTVLVNGVVIEPGADTWTLSIDIVTFHGALCERLKAATPDAPVVLEFRVVP